MFLYTRVKKQYLLLFIQIPFLFVSKTRNNPRFFKGTLISTAAVVVFAALILATVLGAVVLTTAEEEKKEFVLLFVVVVVVVEVVIDLEEEEVALVLVLAVGVVVAESVSSGNGYFLGLPLFFFGVLQCIVINICIVFTLRKSWLDLFRGCHLQ